VPAPCREIVSEEAFLAWADEKQHASEDERLYLNKVRTGLGRGPGGWG
jgi:hypothetical protein